MIRKKIDYYILILAVLSILMGIIIFGRVIDNGFFYIAAAGDTYNQYIHFFNMFHDLVRSGEMPFWSWTYGLGGSFWNEFGYYMLGDIFIWPLLLLPKSWFLYSFVPMTVLKLFLISLGTYLLLKKIGVKSWIALSAGIANSFALFNFDHFYTHYFFLNATVYFPFILLGYERFMTHKKPVLLFITLFLASISNFYFLFMISIGLFFYSLFRYFASRETQKTLKSFVLYHMKMSGVYLLALGTAMVFFLPSAISMFKSNALHRPDQPIIDKVLGFEEVIPKLMWEGGISFLPFLLIPLLLINWKKTNFIYALMGTVLLIMLMIQDLNSVVAGFSSPFEFRALFIYNLLFIVIAAIALNDIDFRKWKNSLGVLILSLLLFLWLENNPFTHYAEFIKFLPIFFAIFVISATFVKHVAFKRIFFTLVTISILTYSLLLPYSLMTDLIDKSKGKEIGDTHKGVWGVLPLMDSEKYEKIFNNNLVKETLEKMPEDDSFYRMNTTYPGVLGFNSSMTYDYSTFISYQSLLKWDLQKFEMDFLANPGSRRINVINGYTGNTYVNTILGNKYNVSINGNQNMYGYDSVLDDGSTRIETNKYALPVGFLYSSAMAMSDFVSADFPSHDELMVRNAVVSDNDFNELNLSTDEKTTVKTIGALSQAKFDENTDIRKQSSGVLVESDLPIEISLPVDQHKLSELTVYADIEPYTKNKGITLSASTSLGAASVFEKNMKYNQYMVYQYHYTDTINKVLFRFGMDEKTEWVKLILQPGKFLLKDVRVTISDYESYKKLITSYQKKSLKNIKNGNNYISGEYSTTDESLLFLSIPFSPGWKASIDGERVETFPVHDTFTGLKAPKGNHQVELTYVPEGFIAGLNISIISLLLFIFLLIRIRSRK